MSNRYIRRVARGLSRGTKACRAGLSNSKRRHRLKTGVKRRILPFLGLLAAAVVLLVANAVTAQDFFHGRQFNKPGNILIADQFNNRVIEADPAGNIVWSFGRGPNDFSAKSIIGVNDAQRVGPFTLMAGTGTPAGVIPQAPNGAPDNRVIMVDPFGKIVWQYGQFGQTGSGPNLLNTPVQSTFLPNSHILITDQANNRIIEVTLAKKIVWQYPGSNANAADQLNSPNSAELLENGHVLIADENNNRAIEVTRDDQIVKTFTANGTLGAVAFASRLDNGDTLLTDAGNSRAVEVDANDNVVWQYVTNTDPLSIPSPLPTRAVRLRDGDTLISDQFNNRVIRVSSSGRILASYGLPLAGGAGPIGNNVGYDLHTTQKGLYSPYDAKVVGDYTGLTPPFDF
jgi:outer membrane protein assembly factor BamB